MGSCQSMCGAEETIAVSVHTTSGLKVASKSHDQDGGTTVNDPRLPDHLQEFTNSVKLE